MRRRFLKLLRQGSSVRAVVDAAGVPRSSLYKWRQTPPDFAVAWCAVPAGGAPLSTEAGRRGAAMDRNPGPRPAACLGHRLPDRWSLKWSKQWSMAADPEWTRVLKVAGANSVARAAAFPASNQGLGGQIRTSIADKQHPFRRGSKWSTSSLVPGPRTPDITPPRGRCGRSSRQPGQIRKEAAVTNSLRVMSVPHLFLCARRREGQAAQARRPPGVRGHGV